MGQQQRIEWLGNVSETVGCIWLPLYFRVCLFGYYVGRFDKDRQLVPYYTEFCITKLYL